MSNAIGILQEKIIWNVEILTEEIPYTNVCTMHALILIYTVLLLFVIL